MAEWNREMPWRQGHLLTVDTCKALGLCHADSPDCTLAIVATHDCDLAQAPESELFVEIIVGRTIEKCDGNFTHAKTARRLHIEFEGEISCLAEFEATAKTSVKKEALALHLPDTKSQLSPENRSTFQYWLASRYRRSAFADEFERRLKDETKLARKIAKAVEPHGTYIAGVFFDVDAGADVKRDGPDDTYTLDIYILHTAEPNFMEAEKAAQQVADAIVKAFNDALYTPTKTWQHIELRACDVISETALTYHHFKQLKRWRLEHMSLGSDPQQPVLAE